MARDRRKPSGSSYASRKAALAQALAATPGAVGLRKSTSNLFRDRDNGGTRKLDASSFRRVLGVDPAAGWIDAEGMATYEDLVMAALACGRMPAVVPQLKTITVGGAVAGVGIEATSFRHGLVHQSVLELEVLAGDGNIYLCTADNEHRDLFFGFPNSYGTLGYALRVKAKALPVKAFVRVEHRRHEDPAACFQALARECDSDADFLDGVVFGPGEMYVSSARFVDEAPAASDYTYENIYYRSIREKAVDHLSTHDYLWRWDTDWFWCSRNLGAQVPLIRRLYGRDRLNSRTYTKIMRWNSRWHLTATLDRLSRKHRESVIQDVDVPIDRAPEFLDFFLREIGILPVWICPIRTPPPAARFPLYPMDPAVTYVNFGFWDVVRTREPHPPGHFNRLVERKVEELGGIKSLYSDSYYTPGEFDAIYGGQAYRELKRRYDPQGRLRGLYEKCVLKK
jgi:FAD/FMN-containing dehydrogenase